MALTETILKRIRNYDPACGDTEKQADLVRRIIDEMSDGISHFYFEKKDYTVREAFGTRAQNVIEQFAALPESSDEEGNKHYGLVSFFDCTKKEWRCFRPESVISMDYQYND